MSTILDKIVAQKKIELLEREQQKSLDQLREMISSCPSSRDFRQALRSRMDQCQPAIIAEVKKASPSKGIIRPEFHPAEIARQYEAAGASCLSVLTDVEFFQGHDSYLQAAKAACSLPVLRKDFVIDEYQIYEARVLGADCILLIVAILSDEQLHSFHELALSLGLNVLVEVHDETELARALALSPDMLGINNRNLKTFEVSLETTTRLLKQVPKDTPVITESGVSDREAVLSMLAAGVYGFLVGEAFMREEDPGIALRELFF